MIKVINIISDSNIGGAGRCLINFLKYYDREKFRVKVIVPKESLLVEELKKLNTEVIEVDGIADKSLDISAIKKINAIIKKLNPDIIHTHGTVTGRICGKLCGKKVVYTRHSVFPVNPKIKKGIGRFLNKTLNEFLAHDIIAVAQAAKENLTDGGIDGNKVKVILNGVEQVSKISTQEILEEKEKYNISQDDFVIGIMARLEDVKGHVYLIEATEILKNLYPNIKVLIIGTGNEEENLKSMVSMKNLQDTIIFTGFISDVKSILSIMDLQANASFGTEATSLALLEGMSIGIPAVVSDYGGNPGVISHGENGYIFKIKDSKDMADKIFSLIKDKQTYHYMSRKSIEIFNSKFTAEIYARNIENVYENLIK